MIKFWVYYNKTLNCVEMIYLHVDIWKEKKLSLRRFLQEKISPPDIFFIKIKKCGLRFPDLKK